MKKNLSLLCLVLLFSCDQGESLSKDERMIKALIKIDNYYVSDESNAVTEVKRNETVLGIAKNFNVVVYPITNEQFVTYYHPSRSAKVALAGCSGQNYTTEGVIEGNGCIGLVRRYSDGAVSLTRYCDGRLDSYDCYAAE